jgi:hypothetical protein
MATEPYGYSIPGLAIPEHDFMAMTYIGSNMTGVVYRQGGANGTVVTTLALTYDGNGNVLTITKS